MEWYTHLRLLPAAVEDEPGLREGEEGRGEVGTGEAEGEDAAGEQLAHSAGRDGAPAQVHRAPEHVVHHQSPEAPDGNEYL